MNRKYKVPRKKISILLVSLLVFLITGCNTVFYDTNQKLNEGEQIFMQMPNGSVTEAVYQEAGFYKATISESVGAFVTDGELNWVPDYTGAIDVMNNSYTVRASEEWGKPSIAPENAAMKDIFIGTDTASNSNMNFVILDVFGEGGQKVDGRTHVYGTSPSPDILFVDFDYYNGIPSNNARGDSSSTIFGKYVLEDTNLFNHKNLGHLTLRSEDQVEDGVVGFLVQNANNLPYFELEIYSGEKLASNLIEKVDVFLTPLWPENETITSSNITQNGVTLTWPLINTIAGITPEGYDIYQDGEPIQTVTSAVYQYDVTDLTGGTTYRFDVKAKYNGKDGKDGLSVQVATDGTPVPNFNVSFNVDGGSVIPGQSVPNNGQAAKPLTNPTKTGYSFAGWYTDNTYTTEFDFANPITGATIIYAKWTINNTTSPSSGGGYSAPTSATDGKLTLPAGTAGEVSLDNRIVITIPANATNKELKITIEKLKDSEQQLLTNNKVLASSVYEVLKNFTDNFANPITLTFLFDPNSLKGNQKPVVFYYDETKKEWVEVGGKVNGNKISVEVDHFTKYAVFAVSEDESTDTPPTDTNSTIKINDISDHWAEASIIKAIESGIVKGYRDGTFKPNHSVTRAEFAVMLINALKPQNEAAALTFTDTAKIGAWARTAVAQAVQAGIIKGYADGTFRSDAQITRAEMTSMIAKALKLTIEENATTGFADDKSIPAWVKGSAVALTKLGLMEGTGANQFHSDAQATRAEAVTVLLRMLEQKNE